jgi:tRNA G10  N-methylase Trm11
MSSLNYICVTSFANLSILETARLRDTGNLSLNIIAVSRQTVIIECDPESARKLMKVAGGIFKIARKCGNSLEDLSQCILLPDQTKFGWTISGYCCTEDEIEDTKNFVSDLLKRSSLGKARFVTPAATKDGVEVKISDLKKTVLTSDSKSPSGIDIVVDGCNGQYSFGYTELVSDVDGFKERDLGRPYQDPTTTMSPRLARTLVNLCGLRRGMTILDPYCGLGTILMEALSIGINVIGMDISSSEASRCRENLQWFTRQFQISPKLSWEVIRGDSTKMQKSDLPQIDAIATEPILVPKLDRNPNGSEATKIMHETAKKYRTAINSFAAVLKKKGVLSIVAPELIDDRGRPHGLDLFEIASGSEFRPLRPRCEMIENPCPVPTTKKKIIQRKVFLMELG